MAEAVEDAKLLSRVMSDLKRLALLGLIPEEGAKISARGEFVVGPSNVEEAEDKKMRSYRHKEYGVSGKTLHAWPEGELAPLELVVKNRAEEQNALDAGWSPNSVHGPGGRLVNGAAVDAEPEVVEVRAFAPPGQPQAWDDPLAPFPPKRAKAAKAAKQ